MIIPHFGELPQHLLDRLDPPNTVPLDVIVCVIELLVSGFDVKVVQEDPERILQKLRYVSDGHPEFTVLASYLNAPPVPRIPFLVNCDLEMGKDCPICLQDILESSKFGKMPCCVAILHHSCYWNGVKMGNRRCPFCRTEREVEVIFHHLYVKTEQSLEERGNNDVALEQGSVDEYANRGLRHVSDDDFFHLLVDVSDDTVSDDISSESSRMSRMKDLLILPHFTIYPTTERLLILYIV